MPTGHESGAQRTAEERKGEQGGALEESRSPLIFSERAASRARRCPSVRNGSGEMAASGRASLAAGLSLILASEAGFGFLVDVHARLPCGRIRGFGWAPEAVQNSLLKAALD